MTKKKIIHLSASHVDINNVYPHIEDAISKNQVTSFGDNITLFEDQLSQFLGDSVKTACTNSGTSAIHLALILAGIGANDEVLCQTMTFSATVNPIIYQGAIPVFIDSEVSTWNMCPFHLKKAIEARISNGKKPKAVIVVHSYGMPAQIDEIKKISKAFDIALIEDAAEALGSRYRDRNCGTFGDYGIISFNGNKIITTSAGGALLCKTQQDKDRAIFLATQSKDKAQHYEHSEIGYNYRMSNIAAGIGCAQMKVLKRNIALRRENNEFYKALFSSIEGVTLLSEPNSDYFSNHWLTCVLINGQCRMDRDDILVALNNVNIETRPLWKPMHLQPVFSTMPYFGSRVSEDLFTKGLCLPSGSNLTDDQKERIQSVLFHLLK